MSEKNNILSDIIFATSIGCSLASIYFIYRDHVYNMEYYEKERQVHDHFEEQQNVVIGNIMNKIKDNSIRIGSHVSSMSSFSDTIVKMNLELLELKENNADLRKRLETLENSKESVNNSTYSFLAQSTMDNPNDKPAELEDDISTEEAPEENSDENSEKTQEVLL